MDKGLKHTKFLRKTKVSLDNTLSVPLVLPRGKRTKMKHKYTVKIGQIIVECDSTEAAARLVRELHKRPNPPDVTPWNVDEFQEFAGRIGVYQRRLLSRLLHSPHELSDVELRGEDLSSNQALAGTLSGITKVAQALDIDPQRIYGQATTYKSGKPDRRYRVTHAFRQAALDNDWPSQKDLEITGEDLL